MLIGAFVRRHCSAIFDYCEHSEPGEFVRLQDQRYAKETLDINYPFCKPVSKITDNDRVRYYREIYLVHGVEVKVTSQWYNPPTSKSLPLFQNYLRQRGIEIVGSALDSIKSEAPATNERAARGRFKGNPIGNAQNLLVRNLLSRLGDEQFSAADWADVIAGFDGRCAYCDAENDLVMDHVIPINRQALGEHRLGNLVPSCRSCNTSKSERDFREFLSHDQTRLAAIEAHMTRHAYDPLGHNAKLRQIIEMAHQDVRLLADRYTAIINTVMNDSPTVS